MAKEAMQIILVTAVMAASLWIPAASQAGCTTALIGLAPCLNYISGNSSTPSSSCCSQLASVVQQQAQCLCTVLNGGGSIVGISINQTQALALPGACKVKTPPVSQCKAGAGGSSSSPAKSPSAAPTTPTTPSTTPSDTPSTTPSDTPAAPTGSPSGNGSKSTNGDSSDGSMNKSVMSVVFSALIFGSTLASFF